MPNVDNIVAALSTLRAVSASEKELHGAIGRALTAAGLAWSAEVDLGRDGRIDFLVEGGLGVEVKIKGSRQDLLIQANRYAACASLSGLVIVSRRSNHVSGLPPTLHNKPLRGVYLLHAAI